MFDFLYFDLKLSEVMTELSLMILVVDCQDEPLNITINLQLSCTMALTLKCQEADT